MGKKRKSKSEPSGDAAGSTAEKAAKPRARSRPSSLVDTRVVYCGDNLDQLRKLPDGCILTGT